VVFHSYYYWLYQRPLWAVLSAKNTFTRIIIYYKVILLRVGIFPAKLDFVAWFAKGHNFICQWPWWMCVYWRGGEGEVIRSYNRTFHSIINRTVLMGSRIKTESFSVVGVIFQATTKLFLPFVRTGFHLDYYTSNTYSRLAILMHRVW